MAKKAKTEPKAVLERTYIIPLRREWLKAPAYRRAKRAGSAVKAFLVKHMKSENIKIGLFLNKAIWSRGMRNPPHKIKVKAVKDDKGLVTAELFDAPKAKIEAKKDIKEVKKEVKAEKPKETTEKHEAVSEKTKKVEAEELKTIRKEKAPDPKVAAKVKEAPVKKPISTQKEN